MICSEGGILCKCLLLLVGVNCTYEVCTVVSKQICANGCYGCEAVLIGWETSRAYWIDPLISLELEDTA